MNQKDERELEKPETWDFEHPQVREPAKASRVVVSVAFRREDFMLVSASAEQSGKKVSEFIRKAALEKASGQGAVTFLRGSGSVGTVWWADRTPVTRVNAYELAVLKEEAATTYG
ncbi:MAG: hypothetical protein FJ316_04155 [SAR202 cluster bacterium]|nr:hypothetical protein [SAR202 cluster bacterium]